MPTPRRGRLHLKLKKKIDNRVWYIAKRNVGRTYYVCEVTETNIVKWTRNRRKAIQFDAEYAVHQFLNSKLNGRKDVYLVHARREKE